MPLNRVPGRTRLGAVSSAFMLAIVVLTTAIGMDIQPKSANAHRLSIGVQSGRSYTHAAPVDRCPAPGDAPRTENERRAAGQEQRTTGQHARIMEGGVIARRRGRVVEEKREEKFVRLFASTTLARVGNPFERFDDPKYRVDLMAEPSTNRSGIAEVQVVDVSVP